MAVTLPDINDWISDLDGQAPALRLGEARLPALQRAARSGAHALDGRAAQASWHADGAALAMAVIDAVRSYHLGRGTKRAELSWILEDNLPMRRDDRAAGRDPLQDLSHLRKGLA